jgi:hypothetical protein
LQNAIRAMPCRPCAWCREPTALEICPFCAMVQPVPQPMDQSQGPPPQPSSAPPQPVVGPQQPGSAAPPARPQAGPAPARPVPHPPRPPAPQPRQPAYGWYEQTRAPTGVPPPEAPPSTAPASQPRPPAGGESRSSAGERVHTVTFAVPDFRTDNGTNGSTSLSDPPPTSNGASSPN